MQSGSLWNFRQENIPDTRTDLLNPFIFILSNFISLMSNQIGIAQARSFLLGIGNQVNEISDKRKANVFFNLNVDKSASSSNRISIAEARALLSDF